jgi:hypothetical protein
MNVIKKKKFQQINLQDEFFDSLRDAYVGFDSWFEKKAKNNQEEYIFEENGIQGFLYLKNEDEVDTNISPIFSKNERLKVGTFKINAHGTKLGERFMKIIFDNMINRGLYESYVTIFSKHSGLITLLEKYGFEYYGVKVSGSGEEDVYVKRLDDIKNDVLLDYPKIVTEGKRKGMLSIWPKYHTDMFPDSRLNTETNHQICDIPATNNIEKVYLSGAPFEGYGNGDILVIYRTKDVNRIAEYSSTATSICVIKEIKDINEFHNFDSFYDYCKKGSVFTIDEFRRFWREKKYNSIIKMTYNVAFNKRIIRQKLIHDVGISRGRWVLVDLNDDEFEKIIELGEVNENIIID